MANQNNELTQALQKLAEDSPHRSQTARLRSVMTEVEAALAIGVSRVAVFDTLKSHGFTMSFKSFESALYRIRKNRMVAHTANDLAAITHGEEKSHGVIVSESPKTDPDELDLGGVESFSNKGIRQGIGNKFIKDDLLHPTIRKVIKK